MKNIYDKTGVLRGLAALEAAGYPHEFISIVTHLASHLQSAVAFRVGQMPRNDKPIIHAYKGIDTKTKTSTIKEGGLIVAGYIPLDQETFGRRDKNNNLNYPIKAGANSFHQIESLESIMEGLANKSYKNFVVQDERLYFEPVITAEHGLKYSINLNEPLAATEQTNLNTNAVNFIPQTDNWSKKTTPWLKKSNLDTNQLAEIGLDEKIIDRLAHLNHTFFSVDYETKAKPRSPLLVLADENNRPVTGDADLLWLGMSPEQRKNQSTLYHAYNLHDAYEVATVKESLPFLSLQYILDKVMAIEMATAHDEKKKYVLDCLNNELLKQGVSEFTPDFVNQINYNQLLDALERRLIQDGKIEALTNFKGEPISFFDAEYRFLISEPVDESLLLTKSITTAHEIKFANAVNGLVRLDQDVQMHNNLIQHGSECFNPSPSDINSPMMHIWEGQIYVTLSEKDLIDFTLQPGYLEKNFIYISPKWDMQNWGRVIARQLELNQEITPELRNTYDHFLHEKQPEAKSPSSPPLVNIEFEEKNERVPLTSFKTSMIDKQKSTSFNDLFVHTREEIHLSPAYLKKNPLSKSADVENTLASPMNALNQAASARRHSLANTDIGSTHSILSSIKRNGEFISDKFKKAAIGLISPRLGSIAEAETPQEKKKLSKSDSNFDLDDPKTDTRRPRRT